MSRSTDNGATWNYTFANYLGDSANVYNGGATCYIDPSMVAVPENGTDTLYLLVDIYPYGVALNGNKETTPSYGTGFDSNGNLLLKKNGESAYNYYLNLTDYTIHSTDGTAVSGYDVDGYFSITWTDGGATQYSNLFYKGAPFQVVRTGFLHLTTSTDGGKTWSTPTLLNLKNTTEMVCLVAPGRGIYTSDGTLVFPIYSYNGSEASQRMGFIYRESNGEWKRSDYSTMTGTSATWASESVAVELEDGTLRFFFRNGTGYLSYVDVTKTNGTYTWGSTVATSVRTNTNCQISAISYSEKTEDGKQVLVVSCPEGNGTVASGASYRLNGKIFVGAVNEDKTITWLDELKTSVDSKHSTNPNYFMYSCLTEMSDGSLALLYEDLESGWGTGDNYYYRMSFDTFDFIKQVSEINTSEIDVHVKPGETITLVNSDGYYTEYEAAENADTYVDVTLGLDTTGANLKQITAASDFVSGESYWIVSEKVEHVLSADTKVVDGYTRLAMPDSAVTSDSATWKLDNVTVSANGSSLTGTLSNNGNYLTVGDKKSQTTTTENILTLKASSNWSGAWYVIDPSGYYLDSVDTSNYAAGGYNSANVENWESSHWKFYVPNATSIAITGKEEGTTTIKVGSMQYNIIVSEYDDIVNINLEVGDSVTMTNESTYYDESTVKTGDSAVVSTVLAPVPESKEQVTVLEAGAYYWIALNQAPAWLLSDEGKTLDYTANNVTVQHDRLKLAKNETITVDSTMWKLELDADDTDGFPYRLSTSEGYLNAAEDSEGTKLTRNAACTDDDDYTLNIQASGTSWLVSTDNVYHGDPDGDNVTRTGYLNCLTNTDAEKDAGFHAGANAGASNWTGNKWNLFKSAETEVTFTGLEKGKVTVVVGDTLYNIVVGTEEEIPPVQVDWTGLENAVRDAEALNAEDYTEESWNALQEVLAALEFLPEEPTQEILDNATKEIRDAIAALEEKEEVPPAEENEVIRIAGAGRIDTGLAVADTLKETLGLEKFETVIIATSKTFADALPGSYLAYVENAPILLISDARMDDVVAYVKANLVDGGKVYILGGEAAVSASLEGKLAGYDVDRLAGSGRYETNMMILDRAGVTGGEIIVATGKSFADSLSASAAKLPILMVKDALNADQKSMLATMNVEKFYIVGGESAVSAAVADELAAYASVERVAGANRRETSIAVAQKFFENPDMAVVASASNFPDGLCGGPLAAALNAPLILTVDGKTTEAAAYTAELGIEAGYVLGGTAVLADDSVVNVFKLTSADEIVLVK